LRNLREVREIEVAAELRLVIQRINEQYSGATVVWGLLDPTRPTPRGGRTRSTQGASADGYGRAEVIPSRKPAGKSLVLTQLDCKTIPLCS
jgi:hypothetical protein